MRACPACGASNDPADDFCGNCGTYLGWSDLSASTGTPTSTDTSASAQAPANPPAVASAATGSTEAPNAPAAPEAQPNADRADTPAAVPSAPTATAATATAGTAPGTDAPGADAADSRPGTGTGSGTGSGSGPGAAPPTGEGPGTPPSPPTASPTPATPRPPTSPTPDPILPVLPAKAVAPRPVVRSAAVQDEGTGRPCPVCGTPNRPERKFCRRCAAELRPVEKAAPLPWWRTVWPFRRRVRAGSGRGVRLIVILAVVVALCAAGLFLLPAGRALWEDTRDKLSKATPVTPVDVKASDALPGHPATNTTDGLNNKYWGVPGAGASVTYTFRKPFRLVDLIITNGASTSPEAYARQARALQVDLEVTTADGTRHDKQLTLSDKPGPQTIQTGISDAKTVRLTLRSPVGLSRGRHLALAEVEFFRRS
ncbi:NADase-type glycan-binding domain-containing protein [Streptomyces sp. NPDC055815]